MEQDFTTKGITPPPQFDDKKFWRSASIFQFIYSVGGLAVGLACVAGGILLFYRGVTGSTSWTAELLGISVSDAAPGVILFTVGLIIVWITKFNVGADKSEPKNPTS